MENAVSALKMAAAVLIFIIAIASSFSLFGTAKQTADSIITMRDRQAYLEAAELDTIMYTSSNAIKEDNANYTDEGDRIVKIDDVIFTIFRYPKEKYAVTIIDVNKQEVLSRFDTATETAIMNENIGNNNVNLEAYEEELLKNIKTQYTKDLTLNLELTEIYKIGTNDIGAPWLGNSKNIQDRINSELYGCEITINNKKYNGAKYDDEGLVSWINGNNKKIVEVIKEIDESKYLLDENEKTDLIQQYEMPTVEIIYLVY